MKAARRQSKIIYALVIPLAGIILLLGLRQLPPGMGGGDFRAYWSTSQLLVQDEECSDDAALLEIQNRETGWPRDYPMRIWNPPWVAAWFLPLALLSFRQATQAWLVINIGLVLTCIFVARQLFDSQSKDMRPLLLLALGVVLFPSTIVAIFMGQVNILVLAGLILFLWLYQRQNDIAAGAVLSLTLIKPHLIFLALLLILLVVLKDRRWKVVLGFAMATLLSIGIVLLRRPAFILECLASTGDGNLLAWQSPTLTSFLSISLDLWWLRFGGLLLVPVVIFLWYRTKDNLPFLIMLDLAIIASIITTPFGWSYDYVLLLLPLMHVWIWLFSGELRRLETFLIFAITLVMYLIYYYQRVLTPNEMYFFWIPLVIAGIYVWAWSRRQKQEPGGINNLS